MEEKELRLHLGVKSDPIEYRFSYDWFFRLLAEEGVRFVQFGTFFEMYQLPDEYFRNLRQRAEDFGLSISSVFAAHRELGGFLREEPGWAEVARKNYERLIEVGVLLGSSSVGASVGAALRDRMGLKNNGIRTGLTHLKELMHVACEKGVPTLNIEPMSCLAEPPTLPHEIRDLAEELKGYHRDHPEDTSTVGYCVDVAHGYADREGRVVHGNMEVLVATLPYATEIHLKNTDSTFNSTFGFSEAEREKGIVDVEEVRDLLVRNAEIVPVRDLIGYLELVGPKTGRDYSDYLLESDLRESIRHLREVFPTVAADVSRATEPLPARVQTAALSKENRVKIAPSLMCTDLCHFEESVRLLERCGVDILHIDIMDAAFAPNMPLGLEILKQLRPKTNLPFDVHLMVENNQFFIEEFGKIGVQMISVHAESAVHLDRTLSQIRDLGIRAGVALNPATPLSAIEYVLDKIDFVMLMTVNPGFAGQELVETTLRKISDCRQRLNEADLDIPIEVDGNVSFANIPRMVAAGADILVAGTSSAFDRGGSIAENIGKMRIAITEGLKARSEPREYVIRSPFRADRGQKESGPS